MMISPIITGYCSTLQNNKTMILTDKRFWIREIALTVALSAMPLTMYGENIRVIMLIVASYAVVAGISVISVAKLSVFATWALIFCAANGAYIIDLIIIDSLRLIRMESYPLIVGQLYLFPVCLLANALVCIIGGIIYRKINKATKGGKR